MKFGIFQIIRDHLSTLRNDRTKKVSKFDLGVLYLLPVALSVFVSKITTSIAETAISEFVSAVSVFSAILVPSQFAIHAMLSRPLPAGNDGVERAIMFEERKTEIEILGEIHSTISYLIGFGVVSLFLALSLSMVNLCPNIEIAILAWFTLHFVLTTLIVVKRIHVLLSRSYQRSLNEVRVAKKHS